MPGSRKWSFASSSASHCIVLDHARHSACGIVAAASGTTGAAKNGNLHELDHSGDPVLVRALVQVVAATAERAS